MKSKKNSLLEPNLSNIDQDDTLEDGEYQPETIPVLLKPNSISQKNHRYAPYQSNQRTSNQRKVDNPTQEYVRTSRVSQRPPYHPQQQQQQPHSLQKQTLLQQQQPLQTLLQQQQQFPLQQQQQQQLLPQIPDSSSITTSMKSSSLANSTALMNPQLLGINMDASSMARVQILANIIQMQQQQQQHQQQQAQQQAQLTQSILMSMNPNLFSNVLQPQTIQSSNLLQPNTNQLNYSLQSSQGQSIPSNPFVGFHNPFIQSGHAMHNQGFNLTGSSLNQHTGDSSNQQQYHQIPTHSSIAVDRKSLEMYNLFLQSQIQSQQ